MFGSFPWKLDGARCILAKVTISFMDSLHHNFSLAPRWKINCPWWISFFYISPLKCIGRWDSYNYKTCKCSASRACWLFTIHRLKSVVQSTEFGKSSKGNESNNLDTNTNLILISELERELSTNNSNKAKYLILNIMTVLLYSTLKIITKF